MCVCVLCCTCSGYSACDFAFSGADADRRFGRGYRGILATLETDLERVEIRLKLPFNPLLYLWRAFIRLQISYVHPQQILHISHIQHLHNTNDGVLLYEKYSQVRCEPSLGDCKQASGGRALTHEAQPCAVLKKQHGVVFLQMVVGQKDDKSARNNLLDNYWTLSPSLGFLRVRVVERSWEYLQVLRWCCCVWVYDWVTSMQLLVARLCLSCHSLVITNSTFGHTEEVYLASSGWEWYQW